MLPDYSDRGRLWRGCRYVTAALVAVGAAVFLVQTATARNAGDPTLPVVGSLLFGSGVLSAGLVLLLFRRRVVESDRGRLQVDSETGVVLVGSLFAAVGVVVAGMPFVYG